MSSGVGYFASGYWPSYYWAGAFWALTPEPGGDYWAGHYWATNFWATNFWVESAFDPGDVFVLSEGTLSLTEHDPVVFVGVDIQSTTENLGLTAYPSAVQNAVEVLATGRSIFLESYAVGIGASGYVLGDITVTFVTDSAITITNGAAPETAGKGITAYQPTVQADENINVAVGPPTTLAANPFDVLAANNVAVEVLNYGAVGITPAQPVAGRGEQVGQIRPDDLTKYAYPATITGTQISDIKQESVGEIAIEAYSVGVGGKSAYRLPRPTFGGDYSIVNLVAGRYPSSYEICDRTGFRVRHGGLMEEWTGAMVREKSWERRNIQEFVRGVGDTQEGSARPEQRDEYVFDRHPDGVTADDL